MTLQPLPQKKRLGTTVLFTIIVILLSLTVLQAAPADNLSRLLGKQDAALVIDENDTILFSQNADKRLIPASTLKIFTSTAAIHLLGPDFRFHTEFYLDKENNLIVKGYGDPLFLSEAIPDIARQIRLKASQINDLVLDPYYFEYPINVPGAASRSVQPYDAPNGAISINFNTVHFKQDANGNYVSAEPQTPLLPFVMKRILSSRLKQGRIILFNEKDEFILYAGHLLSYFFREQGIDVKGNIRLGKVNTGDTLVLDHTSKLSLTDVLRGMMEYSNNFIANQLLLTMGAKQYGPPATLDKGLRAINAYAASMLNLKNYTLVEGSGLSRGNRISASTLAVILKTFQPYHAVMRQEGNEYYKTGTLSGIRTRAGYITDDHGKMIRFVVFVNTKGRSTRPVMKYIHQMINPPPN